MIGDLISFLTIQVCALILIKHFLNIDVLNLHLLSFIIFLGGCYLTYVKQFIIIDKKYDVSGPELHVGNIIFHIIPFIYIWLVYRLDRTHMLETLMYLTIYLYFFNPKKKYYISDKEYRVYCMFIVIVILLFYMVI